MNNETEKVFITNIARQASEELGLSYTDVLKVLKKACEITAQDIFINGFQVQFTGFFTLVPVFKRAIRTKSLENNNNLTIPPMFTVSVRRGNKYRYKLKKK